MSQMFLLFIMQIQCFILKKLAPGANRLAPGANLACGGNGLASDASFCS